jgi:hypothetical protein
MARLNMKMNAQPKYLRRDAHPTMPVIYKLSLKGVKCETWRCSEAQWIAIEFADKNGNVGVGSSTALKMISAKDWARVQRGGQR